MRNIALLFFAIIFFSGMIWDSEHGETLWMIGIGLLGFAASFLLPKDFP